MGTVRLRIEVDTSECDDETTAAIAQWGNQLRDALKEALASSGSELQISKTVREDGSTLERIVEITEEERLAARVRELYQENRMLMQLLVDCDEVALRRGDQYGLCDAIDNSGAAYPSAACAALIERFRVGEKIRPMLFLKDLK